VCDTLCILGDGLTLFAKNSDRPMSEPQVVDAHPRRRAGPSLSTQYIEIPDADACATLLSRPTWLWGAEHGVNEHRVAIGNEMIFTLDDPRPVPPALIGMDLVRLALERSSTAEDALDLMTDLLFRHGQGGIGDPAHSLSYWSSFLIADPTSAWILETSARTWAARPVSSGAAISNRLTLRSDWTRASADVLPGTDIDTWRHPDLPTGFADTRLAAGRAVVASACAAPAGPRCDPRAVVAALRDHGPGAKAAPAPEEVSPDGEGWSLCLHAGETATTTASMVALLPSDPSVPPRGWVALGSPCVSVYVPVPLPDPSGLAAPLPAVVGDAEVWGRFAAVRDAVGSDPGALDYVRTELSVLETALWDEADDLDADPLSWESFGAAATGAVDRVLDTLAAAGFGPAKRPVGDR
jgi:secernin